jgi:hypothetical protein
MRKFASWEEVNDWRVSRGRYSARWARWGKRKSMVAAGLGGWRRKAVPTTTGETGGTMYRAPTTAEIR